MARYKLMVLRYTPKDKFDDVVPINIAMFEKRAFTRDDIDELLIALDSITKGGKVKAFDKKFQKLGWK